ncbi:4'-phosphopantetheinyl transferase superfamily protein [Actinoplanes missouriensis]|uniref:4'-phosphopantetheinyl transferase family protein n=1 Tax=Actinoplanes missouriensis TaxID=1866 RepID=UPI0033EC59AB
MSGSVAQVWCASVTAGAEAATRDDVLSADERGRSARLRRAADRAAFATAWRLVRNALSAAEPAVSPRDWRFLRSALGRPEVDRPGWARGLHFNLSHTDGLVACVVARDARCGVDVERPRPSVPVDRLAGAVLSDRERRDLAGAPPAARQELFFRYWTVKEAYLKAIGTGMRFPMTACEFEVGDSRPALRSAAAGPDHRLYTFRQWTVHRDGLLAVAVRGTAVDVQLCDRVLR